MFMLTYINDKDNDVNSEDVDVHHLTYIICYHHYKH